MTFPFPFFSPSELASKVVSITNRNGVWSTADSSNPTTSSINLGSNSGTRRFVIAVGVSGTGNTINSVTLAGVSATPLISQVSQGGRNFRFYYADTAATGTQTLSASLSATSITTLFNLWELGAPVLPYATATNTASNTTTISTNIDVIKNGGIIAAAFYGDSAPGTCTWTGVTEHSDSSSETFASWTAGIAAPPLAAETGRLIRSVNTATITDSIIVALSF